MKNKFRLTILIAAACVLLLGACMPLMTATPAATEPPPATATTAATAVPVPTAVPTPAPTAVPVLDAETLKNFIYISEFGRKGLIPLQNGEYQEDCDTTVDCIRSRLVDPLAFGDLNGDGKLDAAVLMITNTGGTGNFATLTVILDTERGPAQAVSIFLDDRPILNNLEISEDGVLTLDFVGHGANDPFCCPTLHLRNTYRLHGSSLEMLTNDVVP